MDHIDLIQDALRTGDFAALPGLPEDERLDAKKIPYDLSSPTDRCELAKDVSAFANARGGYLLLGPATKPDPLRATDVITTVDLLQPEDFDPAQYLGVINTLVYPKIAGLQVDFIFSTKGGGGIGALFVPQQVKDRGPFLITQVVVDGEKLNSNFVAYYERDGAHNRPLTAKELHRRFKEGVDSTSTRLSRIEDKIDTLLDQSAEPDTDGPAQDQLLTERLSKALQEAE